MAEQPNVATGTIGGVGSDGPLIYGPSVVHRVTDRRVGQSPARRALKRSVDILFSTVGLMLALPFLLIVMVAIVLDSPSSPIFVHARIGRFGTSFGLIKLRTMVPRAEERLRACLEDRADLLEQWQCGRKLREDPRVTRVGAILRRCSLDEIPQLINVLLGQMSLVGPRPVVSEEASLFGEDLPLVLSVRPGLTGLWAVSGRADLSYSERVALEARYVRECSLIGDLLILLRTIPRVLQRRGAY